jgi:hypothetical protein
VNWGDERYVKIFTRDTDSWLVWSWETRSLWCLLLRKVDRSGVIETRRGAKGIAAIVQMPLDVVERCLRELLDDGCLVADERGFLVPNYIDAQETPQSDAQRQRTSRERRRDQIKSGAREAVKGGHVYFIQGVDGGPIKIGFSEDVGVRLADLQVGHAVELRVLATTPGDVLAEREMQERFSAYRIRGEWFADNFEIRAYIDLLRSSRDVTGGHAVSLLPSLPPYPTKPSDSDLRSDISSSGPEKNEEVFVSVSESGQGASPHDANAASVAKAPGAALRDSRLTSVSEMALAVAKHGADAVVRELEQRGFPIARPAERAGPKAAPERQQKRPSREDAHR